MPILKPNSNETRDEFIGRCMGDSKMNDEFPDNDQRAAICNTSWKEEKTSSNTRSLDAEIFAVGFWNGWDFTVDDLRDIVIAFDSLKEIHKVPLKMGHNDEQPMTDGQPSLGWVENIWVAGNKLMARFSNIPEIVYKAFKQKLYKHVSIELDSGVQHKGSYYSMVLSGVALLGADIPAVNTLSDLTAFMSKDNLVFKERIAFTAIHGKSSSDDKEPITIDERLKSLEDKFLT